MFEDVCRTHFDFYQNTTSFMWDFVDDMTSTHELPTRYRQLFGMFGRSTCEKVTDPSMLLLLALPYSPPRKYCLVEVI